MGREWDPLSGLSLMGAYAVGLVLLLLPMAACTLVARRFGVTEPVLLVAGGIAGSGLLGFAVFWVYLIGPSIGRPFAIVVDVACAAVLVDACRARFARWRELAVFAPVTALYAAASLFYLALGYLHGGTNRVGDIAEFRFMDRLPGDNYIPMLFARFLESPQRPLPNIISGNFQTSDRPPLQSGYELLQDALLGHWDDAYLHAQVIGTLVQGLWIFGLWAFLRAARRPRWAISLSLAAVLFSGFAFFNSFFVWPKLVAAAGLLLACAVLLVPELESVRGSRVAGVLTGLALGTSMLAHPSTVFALPAILIALAVRRRFPRLRFLVAGAGGLIVSYVPWMLYQRFYQPPANALLELQLADLNAPVPNKSTSQVVIDTYRQLGVHQTLSYKWSNFTYPWRHEFGYLHEAVNLILHGFSAHGSHQLALAHEEVVWQFYFLGTALGVVGLGMLVLVARAVQGLVQRMRGGAAAAASPARGWLRLDLMALLVLVISYLIWCLVLLGPDATLIHQGSYFNVVLAMTLGVLGWWSLSPRLAAVLVCGQAAFNTLLFVRFTPPKGPGSPLNGHGVSSPIAAVLALSFAACLAGLWWVGRQREIEPADVATLGAPAMVPAPLDARAAHELNHLAK